MTSRRDDVFEDLAGDAASALLPMSGVVGKGVMRSLMAEWRRNTSKSLRAAEAASGMSREAFADWAAQEPRAVPLYTTVLWAAG